MFKIKVTHSNQEMRLSEEELAKHINKSAIHQAKTMGHATVHVSNERWHIQYLPNGDNTNCQA